MKRLFRGGVALNMANTRQQLLGSSGYKSPRVEAGGDYYTEVGVAVALDGATVTAGENPIASTVWTIQGLPTGGASGTFTPSANVVNPTFTPDTAGRYLLALTATDDQGVARSDITHVEQAQDGLIEFGGEIITFGGEEIIFGT